MPFSRRPQRRAFPSRSRFRRRGLRSDQDLRRWEFGNFRIINNITVSSGAQTTSATSLAQIVDHLSDTATVQGALDAWKTRSIEVGGIVFSVNTFLNQAPLATLSAHLIQDYELFVDRLTGTGAPTTVPAFNINTPPVIGAASVLTTTGELNFPTRCLWRETRVLPIGALDVGPHPQTYYSGARSIRTKLRLKDDFGLFIAFGAFQSTGTTANITTIFSGSIYWRTSYAR